MFERLKRRHRPAFAAFSVGTKKQGGPDLPGEPAQAWQHRDQGIALARKANFVDAERALKLALAADPRDALTWLELGYVLKDSLQLDHALATFREAIQHFPNEPRMRNGEALVLRDLGQFEEALKALRKAQEIDPLHAGSVTNAVLIEIALGQYDMALKDAERAVQINPELLQAQLNLMTAQLLSRHIDEAMVTANTIASWPQTGSQSRLARVTALQELGREHDALDEILRALDEFPQDPTVAGNAAMIALRVEQFAMGWRLQEARARAPGPSAALVGALAMLTREDDLSQAQVFVHAEQGIGDSIQFIRYVPQLIARGAQVTLGLPAVLEPLYRGCENLGVIVGPGCLPAGIRYHAPLLSLPYLLGDEGQHPPPFAPCLDAQKVATFSQRLGVSARLRIGLAASGNRAHRNDVNRSIPLSFLAPLAGRQNQLVLLQKDLRASDQASAKQMDLIDLSEELHDFSDTAALAACCDLVVSVDSAPAHLAGSLGVPLYLLLPYLADWRWRLSIDRSAWYPSAKLFRQDASRNWQTLLVRLAHELEQDRPELLRRRAGGS